MRVLITGASGCIGHYVVRELLAHTPHALTLVVRDPARLRLTIGDDRARVIRSDLANGSDPRAIAEGVDAAVLAATSWGGPDPDDARRLNVDATGRLIDALQSGGCRRILYFSTASVLARDGAVLPEAERIGSPYIRSKAEARRSIAARADGITTLYPTLVLGGGADAPESHLARLLRELLLRARWLRFVRADGSFHLVHAADIAQVVRALLDRPADTPLPADVILGGEALPVDAAVDALLHWAGRRRGPIALTLGPTLTETAIRAFRVRLAPWDRFCLAQRHFTYRDVRGPASFGLTPRFPTLKSMLDDVLADRR